MSEIGIDLNKLSKRSSRKGTKFQGGFLYFVVIDEINGSPHPLGVETGPHYLNKTCMRCNMTLLMICDMIEIGRHYAEIVRILTHV